MLGLGVLIEAGDGPSSGGRRPTLLALNPAAGVVLAADLGATHARIAIATLSGQPVAERGAEIDIAEGPDVVLAWLVDRFYEMLQANDLSPSDVRAIGMGVPGPVEFATGTVVQPPIMPGWDGVVVPEVLWKDFDVPIFVDNDVNIMGLGEYWSRGLVDEQILFVKVATGIGCGIITNGEVHRGPTAPPATSATYVSRSTRTSFVLAATSIVWRLWPPDPRSPVNWLPKVSTRSTR